MPVPLGSGLGAYGAGVGPFGHDPEDEPTAVATQTPVGAIAFDPYDRVYRRNEDLTMQPSSGPIQRAAHLMLPLNAIPATPGSGINVDRIRRASPLQRRRVIEDELRVSWKSLLDTGQIRMGKVTIEASTPWSGRWDVEVVDLITEQKTTLSNLP